MVEHRWLLYSLFIGLTLGGVPVIWRMVRPLDPMVMITCLVGLLVMAGLALIQPESAGTSSDGALGYVLLAVAGVAGGAAMILPGVSGAYLLLVLGQYVTILAAVDTARQGVTSRDFALLGDAMHVVIPVGVGVVIGIVGLSNLVKLLLEKLPRPTLGVLLGLLMGAVFGLWPFQEPVAPAVGDMVKGVQITSTEMIGEIAREDWPTQVFTPTPLQIAVAIGVALVGFAVSMLIARLGRDGNGK